MYASLFVASLYIKHVYIIYLLSEKMLPKLDVFDSHAISKILSTQHIWHGMVTSYIYVDSSVISFVDC